MSAANDALLVSWELSLHDKRPRTVTLYLEEANRFARWLEDHERPEEAPGDLLAVTRADVQAWLTSLRSAGLAQATLRSRWIVLRNLYGWATEEGEIGQNPLLRVKVDKPHTPAPEVLPDEAVARLLKACEGTGFYERRDLALVRLLLATGVRVSEAVGLSSADVELRDRVARVEGKGGRHRLVRFDQSTAAALDRYLRVRARHRFAHLPNLWIGHRGPMTRKGVPTSLSKRAVEAGIGHVHPHQLRHTWADRWLRNGGNEGDLQLLGGWESTEIMRRYGQARAVDRALAAYDEVRPLG